MLSEHVQLVEKAAEIYLLNDYSIVEQDPGSEQEGHYLGEIRPILLQGRNGVAVNLILKTAQNDVARGKRAISEAFEREFQIYDKILPELLKFQKSCSLSNPFVGIPSYYGGTIEQGKEAILMENLVNCRTWKNPMGMPFENMSLVIKEYAKFHAISLAFRSKLTKEFHKLTENLRLNFLEQREIKNPQLYENQRAIVYDMGNRTVRGNKILELAHKEFVAQYDAFWKVNKLNPENEILAICHGDCHPSNILFDGDSNAEKVFLIDWQLASLCSPIRDVSFVLFTSASKSALTRFEELMDVYYQTISRNLKEFNCDSEKMFSYEKFVEQWNKYYIYGLYRAQVVLKLILTNPKEVNESMSILDVIKAPFDSESIFAQRLRDLFEIVGRRSVIWQRWS